MSEQEEKQRKKLKSDVRWVVFWGIIFALILGYFGQWAAEMTLELALMLTIFGSWFAYKFTKIIIEWDEVEVKSSGSVRSGNVLHDSFVCSKCGAGFERLYDLQWHNCPNEKQGKT
jgi:hypothetical protein